MELFERKRSGFSLHIKDLQGEPCEIENVTPSFTVDEIIKKISKSKDINEEQVKLIYRGLELKLGETLENYGIHSESEISMLKRLKKPIVLFYNYFSDEIIKVDVKLNGELWRFDQIYPKPKRQDSVNVTWEMAIQGNKYIECNNILKDMDTMRNYPYLFWDANIIDSSYANLNKYLDYICMSETVEDKLDRVLEDKGLNIRERFDLITFWLPELKAKKYVKFGFIDEGDYDKLATMDINPKPVIVLRVILVFLPTNDIEEKQNKDIKKPLLNLDNINKKINQTTYIIPKRNNSERTVIEWGGINLL